MSDDRHTDNFEEMLAGSLRNSSVYLDDAGFTDGVMAKVQARRAHRAGRWLQALLVLAMALLLLVKFPVHDLVHSTARYLLAADAALLIQVAVLVLGGFAISVLIWLGRALDAL